MISRRVIWILLAALLLQPPLATVSPGIHAAEEESTPGHTAMAVVDTEGVATPEPTVDVTVTATPEPETPTATPAPAEPTSTPSEEPESTPEPTNEPAPPPTAEPTPALPPAPASEPEASPTSTGTESATPTPPPSCTLSPSAAQVGRTLRVTCAGFAPGETVNIFWDRSSSSIVRASFVANTDGTGSATFRVPEAAGGAHPVIAKGLSSATKVIRTFTVIPSLSVNPRSGVVGASVRATLYGFGAYEPVTIRWRHHPTRSEIVATGTATRAGTAVVWFTVPRTTFGEHLVVGEAAGGSSAERLFVVFPNVKLSPETGRIGSKVTARLYGFAAGETIQIQFFVTESTPKVVAGGVVASTTGTAAVSFTVPQAAEGKHQVLALGSAGNTASRQFTIDEPGERWVEVNLSMQYMTVWEGDQVVNGTYVSTGKPGFETPTGTFRVLYKYVSQTMAGTIGGETYYVPDVPWVMYFTNYGHAIHGAYWHNDFGSTRSHGCINLPTYNTPGWSYDFARWLFYWAPMGMRVVIHY